MFYMIAAKTQLFGHVGVMSSYCVIYFNMGDIFETHFIIPLFEGTALLFSIQRQIAF